MSKLPGIFDSFDNLDQISAEDIAKWLNPQPTLVHIENYLAQKILYPQAVPISAQNMKIDLAILREALRLNKPNLKTAMLGDNPFVNRTLRKLIIPSRFLEFIPDIRILAWAFIDGLLLDREKEDFFEDLWTVVLTGQIDEVVGSILLPEFNDPNGQMDLTILGKTYQVKPETLLIVPCSKERCEANFKFRQGRILGKEDVAVEVYGGKLGIVIDGRSR